ncbi:MAG: RsmE family RNA methyltransferase [Chlamydiota bacterium]
MTQRFYLRCDFAKTTYQIEGSEMRHAKVLRLQEGALITLLNGEGSSALAQVRAEDKMSFKVEILSVTRTIPSPNRSALALGLLKQAGLDLVTEKAVEIGINHLHFFRGERSEKKNLSFSRLERIAVSAMKQSGGLFLPKIALYPSIEAVPREYTSLYYGSLAIQPRVEAQDESSLFYVGPEKGFSEKEHAFLHKIKARAISLSARTLRAETAGILAAYFLERGKQIESC